MVLKFIAYSEQDKLSRDKTSYIKMKRLALRLEQNSVS